MKVLVACEFSGIVRDAFAARGHDAWSCDLLPTERPGNHVQGDVRMLLDYGFDLMIAHPPCTHLAVSGAVWFKNKQREQAEALDFFRLLLDAPIPRIAVENPVGVVSTRIRKPNQVIHPWQFGDEAEKTTCLWLKNLPRLSIDAPLFLKPKIVGRGEFVTFPSGKRMAKWYAHAWNLSDDERRSFRSRTFKGIAEAMAEQWGSLAA